ncbi:MAG: porin, partial [Candidatus Omnitrophica bacterium]|nr:porin [Candidatus Omnitrophota bacterium]
MMKILGSILFSAAFLIPIFSSSVWAESSLEDRLKFLEQEVAVVKRQLELKKEDEDKAKKESPIVTASTKDGFSIKAPDDSLKLKIRGLVQADGRFFTDNQKDNSTTDTFTVRRARLIFDGTVGKLFDFYIMPDFGNGQSTLVDAYGEFKVDPTFKIRAGKFKAPLGLERLQSDAVANFTETGLPSNLLPNREVGFQLSGDIIGDSVNYAVGIFNGTADLASSNAQDSDNNNDKDLVARVFVQPFKNNGPETFKGLGVGVAGSYGHKEASTTPTYKSPGQVNVFSYNSTSADGAHIRISPQAYFYKGSLGLIGEYAVSRQEVARNSGGVPVRDAFSNKAWQVTGNYVLTGELTSYKGITPLTQFDLSKGTWGAFEAVARYGRLDIDDSIFNNGFASLNTSITEANAWGTGLNWYPHKNVRWSLDYDQTDFERGATGGNRKTENVISTRFQVA